VLAGIGVVILGAVAPTAFTVTASAAPTNRAQCTTTGSPGANQGRDSRVLR
jgi:hypothetical protein